MVCKNQTSTIARIDRILIKKAQNNNADLTSGFLNSKIELFLAFSFLFIFTCSQKTKPLSQNWTFLKKNNIYRSISNITLILN
ncbi:hypothetical protein BpHYR1_013782 [Brachionus plicatilis]|uniref:Uncharacterized protein n=1 Tax=Brachionus plicatilis TaxID=10195 RepID=A0A3M7RAL9_BRAPC|nr:hypothetical protein BpHYR1_013782 [Brachionus plicatilis]